MALSLSALQSAYEVITYLASVKEEIEVNKKSCTFIADHLERLLPGIQKLMSSSPDETIAPTACDLLEVCVEAKEFITQFRKSSGHWIVNKARKAYNRVGDKATMENLLKRIERCSQSLHLGVVIDARRAILELKTLFQEDSLKMIKMLEQMCQDAAEREDKREEQHQELQNALQEIRALLRDGDGSGNDDRAQNRGGGGNREQGSVIQQLTALEGSYTLVDISSLGHCASDDDDSALLGSGAFGEVMLMRGKIDSQLYAVKMIRVRRAEKNGVDPERMMGEASNMQRLTHRNIIRIWQQCQSKMGKFYCIVMDYADQGTLHEYISNHGGGGRSSIPTQQIQKWLTQLCAGLHHMHRECKMLHRDLKAQNLLLSTDDMSGELIIRISDLGLASTYESKMSMSKGVGTQIYMSPEKAMGDAHYDEKDDMWAVGCILYELISGVFMSNLTLIPQGSSLAIELNSDVRQSQKLTVVQKLLLPLEEEVQGLSATAQVLVELLQQLLSHAPNERPTAREGNNKLDQHANPCSYWVPPQSLPVSTSMPTLASIESVPKVELTVTIDARQQNQQHNKSFMVYRLRVVHNGRLSERWIRYSVMHQLHQTIQSDTRGLAFPSKSVIFGVAPNKRQSDLNSYFQELLKRRPKFGDLGNRQRLDNFLFAQERVDLAREQVEKARREAEERMRREAEDERARREAEERARREAEEKARKEAEERAKREKEERARREAEERATAKKEEEAKARRVTEEQLVEWAKAAGIQPPTRGLMRKRPDWTKWRQSFDGFDEARRAVEQAAVLTPLIDLRDTNLILQQSPGWDMLSRLSDFARLNLYGVTVRDGSVTELKLVDCSLATLPSSITLLTALAVLDVSVNTLGEQGAKALAEVIKVNGTMTILNVSSNDLTAEGAKLIAAALPECQALTSLNVSNNNLGRRLEKKTLISDNTGIQALATAIPECRAMTSLNFSGNVIGADGAKHVAHALRVHGALTSLNILRNNIRKSGAEALKNAWKSHKALKTICGASDELDLSGKLGSDFDVVVVELKYNGTLESITFGGKKAVTMKAIMTEADFSSNQLGASGAIIVAAFLPKCQALTSLNMSNNSLGGHYEGRFPNRKWISDMAGVKALAAAIPECKAMKKLDISSNNWLGPQGAKSIALVLRQNSTLQELNLADTCLPHPGDGSSDMSGVIELADSVRNNGAMATVNVMGNKIGKEQLSKLQEMMQAHPTLVSLCGIANDATEANRSGLGMDADDAAILAAELPAKGALTSLNLANNDIEAEGAKHVAAALPECKALEKLNMSSNNLMYSPNGTESKAAGKALADAIAGNSVITELDVSNNWKNKNVLNDGASFAKEFAVGLCTNGALTSLDISRSGIPYDQKGSIKRICDSKCIALSL